ncbi:hypothetical protein [Halarcobacter anaerophilus]|nr:hypothetical protein [Halarcobacter anaerophilus]
MENAGVIDPDDIDDYIAYDGYLALYTALDEMTSQDVLNEIKQVD